MKKGAVAVVTDQPELLPMESLPERDDVVSLVQSRSFLDTPKRPRHTGKIILKKLKSDEELARTVCLMLRAGVSQRLVAKRCGIGPHSIALIVSAMRDRGELASVRIHCDRLLDSFVEVGLERVIDGIQNGEIHPGQLSIPVLAAWDKKSQRDAGMVAGTNRTIADVTVESVLALYDLACEAQSKGSACKQLDGKVVTPQDTALDTTPAAKELANGDQGAQGGGGVAPGPDSPRVDGLHSKILGSKEPLPS